MKHEKVKDFIETSIYVNFLNVHQPSEVTFEHITRHLTTVGQTSNEPYRSVTLKSILNRFRPYLNLRAIITFRLFFLTDVSYYCEERKI